MATRLLELITRIETIPDDVNRRVDQAFNSFPVPGTVISHWDDFIACLSRFYCHIECGILGVQSARVFDTAFYQGQLVRLLPRQYRGSMQAAFEMARTGNEGGLLEVLRTLAEAIGREHTDNQIAALVVTYCNQLSPQDQVDASREYVRTYGSILPSELTEGSAVRITANFAKALKQHPYVMRNFRRIGR